MELIIAKIYKILKETESIIEFEERIQLLMSKTFITLVGDVFSQMNNVVQEEKQKDGWTVSRNDEKGITFTFGEVRFHHTSMHDEASNPRHPLDEWLGFRKKQLLKNNFRM